MATEAELKAIYAAAWETGSLYIFLNPSQKKIYDVYAAKKATNIKFVTNCSRKIGKSVLGMFIATEVCLQKKEALVAFVAPTVDNVQKYVKQLYQVVFANCPEGSKPILTRTEIQFVNGSRIMFSGIGRGVGSSYDNLRSFAFDLVILDEAGFSANLDEIVDGALLSTLLPRNGNMLLLSTPPITPDHAFKEYCEQARIDGTYCEITIRDSHYTIEQQEKFIKAVGGLNSAKCQREYFCKFVIDTDFQIIPEWKQEYEQDIPKGPDWKYWHKYLSLDPGWSDFTICLFGYRNWRTKELIIVGEIMTKSPEQTIDLIAQKVIAKEKEVFPDCIITKRISDNNRPDLLKELNLRHGLYFSPVESKSRLDEMVSDVRELVKDGKLWVSPSCLQLIGCLRNGVFVKTKSGNRGKEFARSKTFGHYDALAALIYLVREMNKVGDNPLPPSLGRNIEETFLPKKTIDAEKSRIGDIIGSGLDDAMNQNFNSQEHDAPYD